MTHPPHGAGAPSGPGVPGGPGLSAGVPPQQSAGAPYPVPGQQQPQAPYPQQHAPAAGGSSGTAATGAGSGPYATGQHVLPAQTHKGEHPTGQHAPAGQHGTGPYATGQHGTGPYPAGPAPAPGHVGAPAPAAPRRRSAWSESVDKLRAAAVTEPGRLRLMGAVLALLVLLFGVVTSWQESERAGAAEDVLHRSQPLSDDAATIFSSLADANTAASSGFLSGGQEPKEIRDRYRKSIARASETLATAASNSEADSESARRIAKLNTLLPQYTNLVERARANNRQGLPLGGAYLRYANERMQDELLPTAEELYKNENEHLGGDYDRARPYPWVAIALGLLALGALGAAQYRNYQHTNRVFNHGLVAATAATALALLWLLGGHTLARSGLGESYDSGVRSLNALNDARIAALKARSSENLMLVSRGAETVTLEGVSRDKFDVEHAEEMTELGGADSGALGKAAGLADDDTGSGHVAEAVRNAEEWRTRHKEARTKSEEGDYDNAVRKVIGGGEGDRPTSESADAVDDALKRAAAHEQEQFKESAEDGGGALTALPLGALVLAVLGAAGALVGVGRRLSEYR